MFLFSLDYKFYCLFMLIKNNIRLSRYNLKKYNILIIKKNKKKKKNHLYMQIIKINYIY